MTLLQETWLILLFGYCVFGETNVTMSSLLDSLFEGYDKRFPPKYNESGRDQQVNVSVNMFIMSMFSISESNMDYSMSMFLRERWVDRRLAYDNVLNLTRLEIDTSIMHKVWLPDMFIYNEKESIVHEVTIPNKLLHVYPDGTIQSSMRVTGTFTCLMHLQKYPFDTQECHLVLESYGQSTDNLKFLWSDEKVSLSKEIELPQFSVTGTETYNCDKTYYGISYPCIGVKFILQRNYGYYIIQVYIPSMLIVFLSWVNFWLDPTSTPARISLGLLTVLTMTTQSTGAMANLPHVSYIKAIDVWMAICLSFVFLGLVEFAYVNVQCRLTNRKRSVIGISSSNDKEDINKNNKKSESLEHSITFSQTSENRSSETTVPCFKNLADIERARLVDKLSRVFFPIAFTIFNIFYWTFYFMWEPDIIVEKDY